MTENGQAVAPAEVAPVLVHSGVYSLYETPDGGRHVVYQRTASVDEDGQVRAVEGVDAHLPDIPPEALPIIGAWLEHGFPPAVLAVLQGKANPLAILKAMRGGEDGNGAS